MFTPRRPQQSRRPRRPGAVAIALSATAALALAGCASGGDSGADVPVEGDFAGETLSVAAA